MKSSILLACILTFTTFLSNDTFETYDWSAFDSASQKVDQALQKVLEANMILHDNYMVDFEALPKRTKSQLAILQDAAYVTWLMAEEELGQAEATKYWDQYIPREGSNLKCFEKSMESMGTILPSSYANISTCTLETRTACHLAEIKKMLESNIQFRECLKDRYGNDDIFTFTKDPTIVNH